MSVTCPYCNGAVNEYTVREVCTGACGSYTPPDEEDEDEPEKEPRTFEDMEDNVW